jgi:hypothetical protein
LTKENTAVEPGYVASLGDKGCHWASVTNFSTLSSDHFLQHQTKDTVTKVNK